MTWRTEPVSTFLYALSRIHDTYAVTLGPLTLTGIQVMFVAYPVAVVLACAIILRLIARAGNGGNRKDAREIAE